MQKYQRISDEEQQQIVALYSGGWHLSRIAKHHDRHVSTIRKVLERNHVIFRSGKPKSLGRQQTVDKDIQANMANDYRQGMNESQIASKYGKTRHIVHAALKRLSVRKRSVGKVKREFTDEERSKVLELWNGGSTQESISKEFGSHTIEIFKQLRRLGIPFIRTRKNTRNRIWRFRQRETPDGYIKIKLHPDDPMYSMAIEKGGYALEHRVVMARHIGRPLFTHETVHHINGQRGDNTISNLQLRNGLHGKGYRLRCLDCGSHNVESIQL